MAKKINYNIVSSGSWGNAVIINRVVLVDCGVPISKLREYVDDIKYLFITHVHGDHLNIGTCKWLVANGVKVCCYNSDVLSVLMANGIVGQQMVVGDGFIVRAFDVLHDVLCNGFVFYFGGVSVLYVTDFGDIYDLPDEKFDVIMIESNHYESDDLRVGTFHANANDAANYTVLHLKDGGESVFLHESRR